MKKKMLLSVPKSGTTIRHLFLKSEAFSYYVSDFEKWLRVFGFAGSTVYYSPAYLKSFFYFLESIGILAISQVSNNQISMYMRHLSMIRSERTNRYLSHNYKLNHLNAIKLFSKYLLASNKITLDATLRYARGPVEARRWLTQSEIECLYDKCNAGYSGSLNKVILGIYYGLGLRRMEGIGIDTSDIQWTNGVIYIKRAKNRRDRFVPMSPKVQYDIRSYINGFRAPLLHEKGISMQKALLVTEKGTRFTGNAIYSRVQILARKAELQVPLPLHSLRHSIATHLLGNGLELEKIGQFLGHKSLESTQIYAHLIHKNS
ncbi:MAG: tyrosine-type recombinase/integrase [Bacteroidales bacterium]|jgi:integrase/recombinase XerD|nr:tyrosine-type recombinase/integrase [Bacteroidales bacterium]